MYLEYDWTFGVYRPRFRGVFTEINGYHFFQDMEEAKWVLRLRGLRVGKKTDSRSWRIEIL